MAEVSKSFPSGVSYDVPYDTTRFIEVSIQEVVKTLAEAMVLVISWCISFSRPGGRH